MTDIELKVGGYTVTEDSMEPIELEAGSSVEVKCTGNSPLTTHCTCNS